MREIEVRQIAQLKRRACERRCEIEVPDNATDEEINSLAKAAIENEDWIGPDDITVHDADVDYVDDDIEWEE